MSNLEITLACGTYDRTIPLQDGTVSPPGLDINFIPMSSGELFRRQARHAEFDVAEFSMSTYCIIRSRGDRRLMAIPVFTSRRFRHSHIFVNPDIIEQPSDLVGKRIGCAEYQNTATTWIRGFLNDDYGVDPASVSWFFGGLNSPKREADRIALELPSNLDVTRIASDESLSGLMAAGDIDAIIGPRIPDVYLKPSGERRIQRLFADYEETEKDYYRRTKIFPIMHTVVMRAELYHDHPWMAKTLVEAFEAAKEVGRSRLRHTGALYCSLPWLGRHVEDGDKLSGGEDLFAYGLEPNRHVLETFAGYAWDQGLLDSPLKVEDLFAAETL